MYQAVGNKKPLDVVRTVVDFRSGDRLVLATDGLDYTDPDQVAKLLVTSSPAAEELADALTSAALDGGGNDNVSVVVADITE